MTSPAGETDEKFMLAALAEARLAAAAGEIPIGAVAVKDGNIIARTHNAVEQLHSVTAHAEMRLLHELETLRSDWRIDDCDIYVTKEPCPMCMGALILARARRIVFGAADDRFHISQTLSEHPGSLWHPELVSGVLAEPCLALLREFFQARRGDRH